MLNRYQCTSGSVRCLCLEYGVRRARIRGCAGSDACVQVFKCGANALHGNHLQAAPLLLARGRATKSLNHIENEKCTHASWITNFPLSPTKSEHMHV